MQMSVSELDLRTLQIELHYARLVCSIYDSASAVEKVSYSPQDIWLPSDPVYTPKQ